MTESAKSRVVVVTGTSGGLGLAIARMMTAEGYAVVGISRRSVDPETVGGGYSHLCADLSHLDDLPGLAREIVRRHGTPYALVNNAASGVDGLLPTTPDAGIIGGIELDLLSPILLAKHLVRPVNVTSIVASTGFRGLSVYSAAKAGLEGFTRSLARDVGPRGVTVNCIAPGFLETEMTRSLVSDAQARIRRRSPLDRFVSLEEVSAAVVYLLSDQATGITGTVMTIDAGATA
jgi:3-oxoacyl-[acyl-carrier protein] reductase